MAKRQPINSVAGQVAAMANSRAPLDPPSHVPLDPDAAGFWKDIVAARSREDQQCQDVPRPSAFPLTKFRRVEVGQADLDPVVGVRRLADA